MDEPEDMHGHPRPASRDLVPAGPGLRGFDVDAVLRRSRRVNPGPWMSLLAVTLLLSTAVATGHWIAALVIAVLYLPDRIVAIREDQNELRALEARDDFLDALKARVERQVLKERSMFFLLLLGAVALALLSRTQSDGRAALASSAVFLAWAIVRFAVVAPPLGRELKDLGGGTAAGWATALVSASFVFAVPFILLLVLFGVLRRAVRRVRGLPPEPEEPDS